MCGRYASDIANDNLLAASGEDYAQALAAISEQTAVGHRLTSIRRITRR